MQAWSVADVDAGVNELLFNVSCDKCTFEFASTDGLTFVPTPQRPFAEGATPGTSAVLFPPVLRNETLTPNEPELRGDRLIFSAALYHANRAFRTVMYHAIAPHHGEDVIRIMVNDTGHTGTYGTPLATVNDVRVWIESRNTAPTITAPHSLTAWRHTPLDMQDSTYQPLVLVDDVDARDSTRVDAHGQAVEPRLRLAITASAGVVSLSSLRGIAFLSGAGRRDGDVEMEATLTDLNAALAALRYECNAEDACATGDHTVRFVLNDNGYSGAGGALTATHTLHVHVEEEQFNARFASDEGAI
jgi:hypothetical protein